MEKENSDILKPKLTNSIELFESSVSIWGKNLKNFLMIYLEAIKRAVFPIVVLALLYAFKDIIGTDNLLISWVYVMLGIFSYLMILYYLMRAQIAIFFYIKSNYKASIKEVYKTSLKFFWPYIWLNLILSIFIIAGFFAFIIPGIVLSVIYGFAMYALFVEDKRAMQALSRSSSLVKGYFWPVFARMLFVGLVAFSFSFIISLPILALVKGSLLFNFWNAVIQILSLAIAPIFIIYSYKIYNSLVEFKK